MVKKVKAVEAAPPQTAFQAAVEPAKRFAADSFRLIKRCTKPDAKGSFCGFGYFTR
jgi:hypothetical protein